MPFRGREGIGVAVIQMGKDSITLFSNSWANQAGRLGGEPKPFSKEHQARKSGSVRKSALPEELREAYQSVETSLLSILGIASSEEAGDMGRGDRGGSETPYNNLKLLRTRMTNRQIADEFLNNEAMKEYRKDPFARGKVIAALGSLRDAFPPNVPS